MLKKQAESRPRKISNLDDAFKAAQEQGASDFAAFVLARVNNQVTFRDPER